MGRRQRHPSFLHKEQQQPANQLLQPEPDSPRGHLEHLGRDHHRAEVGRSVHQRRTALRRFYREQHPRDVVYTLRQHAGQHTLLGYVQGNLARRRGRRLYRRWWHYNPHRAQVRCFVDSEPAEGGRLQGGCSRYVHTLRFGRGDEERRCVQRAVAHSAERRDTAAQRRVEVQVRARNTERSWRKRVLRCRLRRLGMGQHPRAALLGDGRLRHSGIHQRGLPVPEQSA